MTGWQEGGRSLLRSFGNRSSWFDKDAAPGRDGFHAVPDQTLGRTDHREGILANTDASEWPVSSCGNITPQGLISDRVEPVPTGRQEGGRSLLRSFGNRSSWFYKDAAPAALLPGEAASVTPRCNSLC